MLYRITTGYFCAGIIVENNIVKEAAPILNWTIGKHILFITSWVDMKNGTIEQLKEFKE